MQVWGGDVSQDHLLGQMGRESGRVEETNSRKVVLKDHLWQEGQSMVLSSDNSSEGSCGSLVRLS